LKIKVRFTGEIEFSSDINRDMRQIRALIKAVKLRADIEYPDTYTEPDVKILRVGDIYIDDVFRRG
jgi:hypothetical protein